jgi:hypothetical protein
MIGIAARQCGVGGKQRHHGRQFAIKLLAMLSRLAGLLAFVIALEFAGILNRPQSDDFADSHCCPP